MLNNHCFLFRRYSTIGKSAEGLLSELNVFRNIVKKKKWNLKVNINRSKVMFFPTGMLPINSKLRMNNMELEIVIEFIYIVYLGTMFQRT
jgi:hypothetical protein